MNRQEKIESIRRGETVIKNDMQGDERCFNIISNFTKNRWSNNHRYYGKEDNDYFRYLYSPELNNRPQILMSELVFQKCRCSNSLEYSNCATDCGRDHFEKQEDQKHKESQPTEQKEVFTVDSKKLDELYKEWSGVSHLDNSGKPIHDSSECTDFANYVIKYFKI